ncbi:MAG: protein kinase, partial [Planctomycetota bacterium JB042]
MPPPAAPRILGDFKIRRELGRGGMGVVYLARQLSLARDVALKVLTEEAGADADRILRFQREAALLGRLAHPNLVRVFVVGEDRGLHFLAMEYVEGTDLERVLARRLEPAGLPAAFASDFRGAAVGAARDAARGLGAAHAEGIVHRNVKPSNILLADDGRVVLADFGLARDLSAAALTRTGTTLGTPYYMSPEQFSGGGATPQADVYALGAVLYEGVTGKRPFDAATPERLMTSILEDEPPPPRRLDARVDRDLETVVLKCLEKDPARRYADGAALAADLTRYLDGEPIEAVAVGTLTRIVRRTRRRRVSLVFLLAAAALALGFLGWGLRGEAVRAREQALDAVITALNEDELATARARMDEELERRPGHAAVRYERAELALREKRWGDAASDFERLLEDGDDPAGAAAGLLLARSIERGAPVEEVPSGPVTSAREAYYRGLMHQTRRELDQALAWTERALELDPGHVEAWYALGGVQHRLGHVDAAEAAFARYDRVRSRADVKKRLGDFDMQKERFESAVAYFERYVRMEPGDVVGWNNLAAAHAKAAIRHARSDDPDAAAAFERERAAAEEALARAKACDADYFLVAYNDAVLRVFAGEIERAEARFRDAIRAFAGDSRTDPEWMGMWSGFAGMLNWTGEIGRALAILEEARAGNPAFEHDPNWIAAKVEALHLDGRVDDATRLLDRALAGP